MKSQRQWVWIGLQDINGGYKWIDGAPYTYSQWERTQPNSGSEKCVAVSKTQFQFSIIALVGFFPISINPLAG